MGRGAAARGFARAFPVLVITLGLIVGAAGVAGAHVTVVPEQAPRGSFVVLGFSVPNERDAANTTKLEVEFPAAQPIAFVSVRPLSGWTVAVTKKPLAKPVTVEGTKVTQVVSSVTWTATGAGLAPGEFDVFTVSAGPLPRKGTSMTFKATQTYSNGDVVRWIQKTAKGAPEPEFPAPVLILTKGAS